MNIKMVGIDYNKAALEYRELFSLSSNYAAEIAQAFISIYHANGAVVLSTCNRTEIWLSDASDSSPLSSFFELKEVDPNEFSHLFVERKGEEAVRYLYTLACGLESQIFGEDQILTQIKQALVLSRENDCTDTVLEVLFRGAITCAKKVKSSCRLTANDASAPARAVALLEEKLGSLEGKRCLVVGNGVMGRLSAKNLVAKKCFVTMTLRKYKRGDVLIPMGTEIIPYDDRYSVLSAIDIVISATSSPHHTLAAETLQPNLSERPLVLVDLAVPRDIDPKVSLLSNVTLYDMDMLGSPTEQFSDNPNLIKATALIDAAITDFRQRYYFKDYVKSVKHISKLAGKEACGKLKNTLKVLPLDDFEKTQLQKAIETAAAKATAKLIYGLKENLEQQNWDECIRALEVSAEELED